jgi:hypothetical protein
MASPTSRRGRLTPKEILLALNAVVFPILPGKTAEWHEFMAELNGPKHAEFVESRRRAGVEERTFLQPTPMGDVVIVTMEGDDPGRSFGQIVSARDPFTTWFLERVKALHGVDLSAPMPDGAPSKLAIDSGSVPVSAK